MEATGNEYTLETLPPLNRSYDREHTLKQKDVDMANRLVEAIEGSRSSHVSGIGCGWIFRGDDDHALLGRKKNDDGMSVCLQPYEPFVGNKEPNPLYGDFTTETWRRFYLYEDGNPEPGIS